MAVIYVQQKVRSSVLGHSSVHSRVSTDPSLAPAPVYSSGVVEIEIMHHFRVILTLFLVGTTSCWRKEAWRVMRESSRVLRVCIASLVRTD